MKITRSIVVVCGSPGSGKTTHANERKSAPDTVLDLDEMRHGQPLEQLLAERNRVLVQEATRDTSSVLWFITTAKRVAEREYWRWVLGARVDLLLTPEQECKRRIEERGYNVAALREANADWWSWYGTEG